ncbi:Plexin-B-like [Oopsacas minuta]|uniref:Plexin-B-like n=1 Tax=Oopsacas minuta TaxID=111878 RepID=A0AAV7JYU1_9METZ|nr:Plexin-B-like [Oopsacas minuta]
MYVFLGFAELQVEIVDFVKAADTNTIPFTDFQTYVTKLLFSKNESIDFLSLPPTDPFEVNNKIEMFRKAMKIFQELFNNKEFLIELIRIFDQNSYIDTGEKSYFASLLMIALHKNLFYATEILKLLIDDLISTSVYTSNRNVKTLFRSTSICEKLLSHWLAVCMYNYLRGLPGEELYNLYSAIKIQINKGPIDAITGEAKYSLNQDNMLRTTLEVKVSNSG